MESRASLYAESGDRIIIYQHSVAAMLPHTDDEFRLVDGWQIVYWLKFWGTYLSMQCAPADTRKNVLASQSINK